MKYFLKRKAAIYSLLPCIFTLGFQPFTLFLVVSITWNCQLELTLNHHRNSPLDLPMRVFPERFNWRKKTNLNVSGHIPIQRYQAEANNLRNSVHPSLPSGNGDNVTSWIKLLLSQLSCCSHSNSYFCITFARYFATAISKVTNVFVICGLHFP